MADDRFKSSIAGLSRALGKRVACHSDPVGEAMERRAAVQAEFARQEQRRTWILGGSAAVLGVMGVVTGILYLARAPDIPGIAPATAVAQAPEPPTPPVVVPPPAPVQIAVAETEAPPAPAPLARAEPASAEPPPVVASLTRDEIRELQTRLARFGFDPGPFDGDAGRLTHAAVEQYQQTRGLPDTGAPNRVLLDQLRQDYTLPVEAPRPPVRQAQRSWRQEPAPAPAPAYQGAPPARRPSGFLESLRSADNSLSRWLNSLSR
jgi:hypothetical protein